MNIDIPAGTNQQKPVTQPMHMHFMEEKHMLDVLAIEAESFEFPWSEQEFKRQGGRRSNIVTKMHDIVVGYMVYRRHGKRIHLLNFAVDFYYRRMGIGTFMIRQLQKRLSPDRQNRLVLHVRETNLQAQLFFRSMEFRAVSVLHDRWDDTTEDAYAMQFKFKNGNDIGLGIESITLDAP